MKINKKSFFEALKLAENVNSTRNYFIKGGSFLYLSNNYIAHFERKNLFANNRVHYN
jgi:hypothetical protein